MCFRKEPTGNQKEVKVYIMTLGVLAPYRRLGVGNALLQHVLDACAVDRNVTAVFLHVQADNEEARSFYERNGFAITETIKDYYKNISPADAHVVEKRVNA